jgi:hypothetical protein
MKFLPMCISRQYELCNNIKIEVNTNECRFTTLLATLHLNVKWARTPLQSYLYYDTDDYMKFA